MAIAPLQGTLEAAFQRLFGRSGFFYHNSKKICTVTAQINTVTGQNCTVAKFYADTGMQHVI
jgi:hypothetical protein